MLLASPEWVAIRRGRIVELFAATEPGGTDLGAAVAGIELDRDDVDLAFTGSPASLVAVFRDPARVVLFSVPQLEATARLELPSPMRLATSTGARLALLSLDGRQLTVARATPKGLAAAPLDPGSPVELAIGLDKNQLLLALYKKLQVWDAVSGRPQLNLTLQLPPPPRLVGAAHGHVWSVRTGSDEVMVYRLSDGRPFKHVVHHDIVDVVSHPASPIVVIVTPSGLVRLHCFSHQIARVESPWTRDASLALTASGDSVTLVGATTGSPWRVPLAGDAPASATPERVAATDDRVPAPVVAMPAGPGREAGAWRDSLAAFAHQLRSEAGALGREVQPELPDVPADSEVAQLAQRLQLGPLARRALVALYALHLAGETPSIARLAAVVGDWTEALGRGHLHALGLVRRRRGNVALRTAVADALDGAPPRAIRIAGGTAAPRPGTTHVSRAGRSDAAITAELVERFGRIATATTSSPRRLARALLEAQVRGATLVAFGAPADRPAPWPRDAALVIVADEPPPWLAPA